MRFERLVLAGLIAIAPAWAQDTGEAAPTAEPAPAEPALEETPAPAETVETIPVDAGAPETPPESSTRLENLVVTSQKRVQSIQDVPISVTALTGQMMWEQGATDVREALQLVPNARVDTAGFFAAPRVRGFTLNNNNKSFEPPVGMVLDGIPHTRIEYFMAALMDLERMEVMRGPQGTSFGKNTTAGLIHLISNPPTSGQQGTLTLEGGELDRRRFEAAYSNEIFEGFDFRLAGLFDERGGFIENTTARVLESAPDELKDRKRTGVRLQVEAPDVWGSTLLVAHEQFELYDGGTALESVSSGPNFQDAVRQYDPNADFIPGNWIHSQDYPDYRDVSISRTRFQLDRPIGNWAVVALGAYSVMDQNLSIDTDFTAAPAILGSGTDHSPETYGEIRFTAPTTDGLLGLSMLPGKSDLLFGVSGGRRQILDSHFTFGINNTPFWELYAGAAADTSDGDGGGLGVPQTGSDKFDEIDQRFEQTSNELSGFAHVQWHFLPKWNLELGGRYTTEKKDAWWDLMFTTPEPNASLRAIGVEPFTATRTLDLQNFQPKISLGWEPFSELSLFVHVEKGFKAGGFNAFALREGVCTDDDNNPMTPSPDPDCQGYQDDDLTFRDEVATNYGVDIKSWLFGHSAALNISFFHEDATDFQVLIRENPPGAQGLGTSRVINAEEAYAQGVELDLRWAITDWLTAFSGIGYLKTEFVGFKLGECPVGHGDPPDDGDPDDPHCNHSGKPFPFAPELSGAMSLRVNLPVPLGGLSFVGGVLAEYESEQYLDIDMDERKLQDPYWRYRADIGLSSPASRWTVRLVGENLTDTVTWVRMGDLFTDQITGSQNQPRLLYLQFRQEF